MAGRRCTSATASCPGRICSQSAIAYAEQGFPVTEAIQEQWAAQTRKLQAHPETARVFLPGGKPPQQGDLFRNPGLARAYRLLAEQGPDAFYKGEIAAAILKTSKRLGGVMTAGGSRLVLVRMGEAHLHPTIAAGASTNFRPTVRAWPRSKC